MATNVFACCHRGRQVLGYRVLMIFWSRYFIPTLKESPADAEIASHRLLIRAGLVRKLGGGLYTYMPLGLRVMQKISRLCREEMERAGAIELSMPNIHPAEFWVDGPRWGPVREIMFRADSAGEGKRGPREPESAVRANRSLPWMAWRLAPAATWMNSWPWIRPSSASPQYIPVPRG